jgi:Transposase domain (DUF772)
MMGDRLVMQEGLFTGSVWTTMLLPTTFCVLSTASSISKGCGGTLAPLYSATGRCFGIRPERRLGEEAHLNLAYRWFCRLGLDGGVPDHSTFSKNRHGRFRDSDAFGHISAPGSMASSFTSRLSQVGPKTWRKSWSKSNTRRSLSFASLSRRR